MKANPNSPVVRQARLIRELEHRIETVYRDTKPYQLAGRFRLRHRRYGWYRGCPKAGRWTSYEQKAVIYPTHTEALHALQAICQAEKMDNRVWELVPEYPSLPKSWVDIDGVDVTNNVTMIDELLEQLADLKSRMLEIADAG